MITDTCQACGAQLHYEAPVWVDNTGGDVCGVEGGNEPHRPLIPMPTVCDHCALPVERVVMDVGSGATLRVWWGAPRPGRPHSIFCDVRMGRHTVAGVPLGEKAELFYCPHCDRDGVPIPHDCSTETPRLKEGTTP